MLQFVANLNATHWEEDMHALNAVKTLANGIGSPGGAMATLLLGGVSFGFYAISTLSAVGL